MLVARVSYSAGVSSTEETDNALAAAYPSDSLRFPEGAITGIETSFSVR